MIYTDLSLGSWEKKLDTIVSQAKLEVSSGRKTWEDLCPLTNLLYSKNIPLNEESFSLLTRRILGEVMQLHTLQIVMERYLIMTTLESPHEMDHLVLNQPSTLPEAIEYSLVLIKKVDSLRRKMGCQYDYFFQKKYHIVPFIEYYQYSQLLTRDIENMERYSEVHKIK